MNKQEYFDFIKSFARENGAFKSSVINVSEVKTDIAFRDMCKANFCGKYGRCYTCPPDIGEIADLNSNLRKYEYMLVFQTVSELEDSFDVEGMEEAGRRHSMLLFSIMDKFGNDRLYLGAGGCTLCPPCAKRTNEPCRFPDKALTSLEAYGINVSDLATVAGMKYINGKDTVTYFGAMLFNY